MGSVLRKPALVDAVTSLVVAAVLLAEVILGDKSGGVTPASLLAIALAAGPLAFASRRPLAVLALSPLGLFALLEACSIYETVALPPVVALYHYARATDRRRSVLAGLAYVPVAMLAMAAYSPHAVISFQTAQNLFYIALPVLAGNAVRDRRAYLSGLHERVEIAERTREEEARRRVGEERLRIAREVHDVMAHSMVAINVQAGVARHLMDRRPEAAREALTEINQVSGDALRDLRDTLGVLRDSDESAPVRPALGLGALDELAGRVRAAGVEVDVERRGSTRPLPVAVDAAGYRIVQEALTNVLRHADASRAGVVLEVSRDALEIDVTDDGVGAHSNGNGSSGTGNGLRGMRERAGAVGGRIEAGGHEGAGWRVHARLPLPAG